MTEGNKQLARRELGRIISGAYYDYQNVRLSSMNRVRDVVRKKKEGIPFDQKEDKKEDKSFSKDFNDKKLPKILDTMLEEGVITKDEYVYIKETMDLINKSSKLEQEYKTYMLKYIGSEKIWTEFLSKIKGIGPVLGANLIKNFGYCERFEMVSSVWKYCGLHVIDGVAAKRKKGEKLDYNPKMKTLAWKIGDSFIKMNTPIYRDIYDRAKERELNRKDDNKPKNKMHAHLRAMRKTVKLFLSHYWACSRTLAGLDTREEYVFAKLGHKNKIKWEDVIHD